MIEDKILNVREEFMAQSVIPPVLLILPFNDYLELMEFAEELSGSLDADYSRGKMYLGMIVDYDFDATDIVIKGKSKIDTTAQKLAGFFC